MDRILKAQNNAIKAYDQTDKELSLVDLSGCSEAYKRAFKRKWNKLVKADKCHCPSCELRYNIEQFIEQKKNERNNRKA